MNFTQWKNRKTVKEILDGKIISKEIEENISRVLQNREVKSAKISSLAYWVKYDVVDDFLERFNRLVEHDPRDSSSKYAFTLRYGEEEGLKRFEEKTKKCAQTERGMIERHGAELGKKKWEEYKHKVSFANSEAGYIERYGVVVGKEKFRKQCERNSGNWSLERKIELHGEEEGLKKFEEMGEKLKKRHSLENYIRLFGEEEGTVKFENLRAMRSYKNSLRYYIEKYGEEEGTRRIKEIKNNCSAFNNYSKISLELFDSLKSFSNNYGDNECLISLEEHEYSICGSWNLKPDFLYEDKIIEFYGDRYHGNPKIYSAEDISHPFTKKLNVGDMWEKDKKRNYVLENRGYRVKIVWESDFKNNPEKIIEECKRFLKNGD